MNDNGNQSSQSNASAPVAIGNFAESISQAITCTESAAGAMRFSPMSRKSFALTKLGADKDGKPLVGKALKRAHWAYLDECANEAQAAVAASIASGKSRVVGFTVNAKGTGGTVRLETAEHFARHEVGESTKQAPAITEDKALAYIAKVKGITVAELQAALELTAAQ